ncbi:MAG: hypothetical protein JWO82_2649 [Akkermansiaceae bacterium]|nr:hypothetical protein [Akkermansiaceae bacterium]
MPRRRLPIVLLFTHAAALAAGVALFGPAGLLARHAADAAAHSPAKPAPQNKSGPREPAATTWTAAEILHQIDQAPRAKIVPSSEQEQASALQAMREELAKSGESASTVFDRELAEHLLNPGLKGTLPARLGALVTLMGQEQDALSLAGYFSRLNPEDYSLQYCLAKAVGSAFGRDASFAHMQELKSTLPPGIWNNSATQIVRSWPNDRRDDLLKWALAENNPSLLGMAGEGISRGEWLAGLLTDEAVPADFRAAMKTDAQVRSQIADSTAVPVATRLENDPGKSTPRELCWRDVDAVFRDPRDWSYLFQTGQTTPAEILAAVSAASPRFAATNSADLRQALYARLVEADPARALTLLDDLSPDQRSAAVLNATIDGNFAAKPDQFLTMLSQIPDTPETRDQRLLAWQQRTSRYLSASPGDYARWIDSLPPGTDRDMALSSAAAELQKYTPGPAAELRRRIADPGLQQKSLIPHR